MWSARIIWSDRTACSRGMLAPGRIPSIILWGPPGTGKTTIARLLAGETGLVFEQMSAIFSGVADLKKAFEQARIRREQGQGHAAVRG